MLYKVYLINISRVSSSLKLPIWISVLTNALKLKGITPVVIDFVSLDIKNAINLYEKAISGEPSILGFSIMAGNDHINHVELYARKASNLNSGHKIVYGGALPSSIPHLILENCVCDYVIAGEGEIAFPELITAIQEGYFFPKNIKGLFYKKNNRIIGTNQTQMDYSHKTRNIYNLNKRSQPDYSLIDMDFYINYLKEIDQSFELMASRGCRGNCSFCHRLVRGLGVRDPDLIIDEISEIIQKYRLKKFYFIDENFLELKFFFKKFINTIIKRKIDFSFIAQCRVDAIDEERCQLGSDNGLRVITLGIESVNQNTLNRINKGIKVRDIEKKISLLRKYNILPFINLMIGFPYDTEDDYLKMINFIIDNGLENCGKVAYVTPLPGTKMWVECIQKGYIKNEFDFIKKMGNLYVERMINLTNLSDAIVDHYYKEVAQLLKRRNMLYPKSKKYLEKMSLQPSN